jgi:hypothetical protein
VQRGFLEGSGNTHPGQGTANRRFFFANAYLELVWISDPAEAQGEAVRPIQLWERCADRASGACPFGIVFRPESVPPTEPPFPCWSYRPEYLPSGLSIEIGRDQKLQEPELFYLPFLRPGPSRPEPRSHPCGIDRIARVTVSVPTGHDSSATLVQALDAGLFTLKRAPEYLLELAFRGERVMPLDLRPDLPLLFAPDAAPS